MSFLTQNYYNLQLSITFIFYLYLYKIVSLCNNILYLFFYSIIYMYNLIQKYIHYPNLFYTIEKLL